MKKDKNSEWITVDDVTEPSTLEYNMKDIEYGKRYNLMVTAWNKYGESNKEDASAKTVTVPLAKPTCETNTSGKQKYNC